LSRATGTVPVPREMCLPKKYAEKLADGRELFIETFDLGVLGDAPEYTEEGVVRRSFRLIEGERQPGTLGCIEGVAAKGGIINKNRRLYSTRVYKLATERAQPMLKGGNFLGEVDHPDWSGSLQGAALRFTKLEMDGDLVKFEANILKTKPGRHLKGLIEGKVGVQISTRGYASSTVEKRTLGGVEVPIIVIAEDLHLEGIDTVLFASNPAGRVTNATIESAVADTTTHEEQAMKNVAELRAAHPALVAELEAAAREGYVPQSDVEAKVTAAKAEGVQAGKTAALESTDIVAQRATVAAVLEALKPHLPAATAAADTKNESDAEKLAAKLAAQVETLSATVESLKVENTTAKAATDAAALRVKVSEKVATTLKGHVHADVLRPKLEAAKTVEEVDSLFADQEALIASIAAREKVAGKTGGKGEGKADVADPNASNESVDEAVQKARSRRIAGIPEPKK
jgi:hypothetical protein